MNRSQPQVVLHAAIGGFLAGAVVVLWFVIVDFAAGQPFHTPARLASIVLGESYAGPWPRLITVFTILHFGIFVSLGIMAAALLRLFAVDPGLTLGLIFGVTVFNVVHYLGLLITGTNLLSVIPVPHVVVANLLGGMVLMTYLHRALRVETPLGWDIMRRYPVVFEGVSTGLIGAAAVALWFFGIDLVVARPFYTPAALGSAILLGANGPAEVRLNLGILLAYSFLHVAAFVSVGIAFAWLASRARLGPGYWLRGAVVLLFIEALFLGTVELLAGWVIAAVGGAAIAVGNLLAVVAMGLWIWRRQPRLRAA